ncbi:O-antigen ligase family protein [Arenicella xantha]|uniref:O-antigen ligase n=1 Tax=Arenicella xantha TaxID=644221 RepID=A0A395JRA5_9GAMM|nr:O-antigen ligase family protein [Arenicella xantha]RBP53095.1 O-antigen ligase [Arenicella xantha]
MLIHNSKTTQSLRLVICVSIVAYILLWLLDTRHFYLILKQLQLIVLSMVVATLFLDTKKIRPNSALCIWSIIFVVIATLSTNASLNYLVSSIKIWLDFFLIAFGVLLWLVFSKQLSKSTELILLVIVLVFLIGSCPTTLLELYDQMPVEPLGSWPEGFELTHSFDLSLYEHLRVYSFHAFIAAASAYSLWRIEAKSKGKKYFYLCCFAVCLLALLLAYGRGSILAFLVFVACDTYLAYGVSRAIKVLGLNILLIGLIYALFMFTPFSVVSEYLFSSFLPGGDGEVLQIANSVSSGRLTMWVEGINLAKESPVFGHGASSAVWLFADTPYSFASQPHNVFVQITMDYGFVGACVLIWIVCSLYIPIVINVIKESHSVGYGGALLAILAGYAAYSLTDGVFYHPYPLLHFTIISVLLFSLENRGYCKDIPS